MNSLRIFDLTQIRMMRDKQSWLPILEDDNELVRSFTKGFPEMPFFRHVKGIKGCKAEVPFGKKYFYKWWIKACGRVDVDSVDLYGGTRHSTALAIRELATPVQIKRATMHSTNKAFERYFRVETQELKEIYQKTRGVIPVSYQNDDRKVSNLLELKQKIGGGGRSRTQVPPRLARVCEEVADIWPTVADVFSDRFEMFNEMRT